MKPEERYSLPQLDTLKFVKMERVGSWFDFYTDTGKKYSTCYEDRANLVKLDIEMMYETKYDNLSKQWRVMHPIPWVHKAII